MIKPQNFEYRGSSMSLDAIVQALRDGRGQTAETSETLPPPVYNSHDFFDLEVEKIFRAEWICVGHVSQVAKVGDYFTLEVLGEPIVVARGADRIRVMSSVCLHRWAPVVEGEGNTKVFSCPFHRWGYALDGQLLGAPFMDKAEDFVPKASRLPELRTEIVEALGLIFITFSGSAEPLTPRLSEMIKRLENWRMHELVAVAPAVMDAKFNWKIQLETGMECYHHFAAHAGRFEVNYPTRLSWCEESRAAWSICHSPPRPELPVEDLTMGFPVMPHLTPDEQRAFDLYHIFPLTRLSAFCDRINFRILLPTGPQRTWSKMFWLVRPEVAADPELVACCVAGSQGFSDQSTKEDYDINLMQQVGANSVLARPGRLSHLEATVWHLAEYVRNRVTA